MSTSINEKGHLLTTPETVEETVNVMNEFINLERNMHKSLEFAVHVLLRFYTNKNDKGFEWSNIECFQWFIEQLRNLLMNPKVSALLLKNGAYDAPEIAEKLNNLSDFFTTLQEPFYTAIIQKYDVESSYGIGITQKELKDYRIYYERELELLQAKKAIMKEYEDKFD